MTGEETFPIIGQLVTEDQARKVIAQFKGLNPYWNCIDKVEIAYQHFGGVPTVGSLHVISGDYTSTYGFEYNPPFEIHAWLTVSIEPVEVIDLALPGVIQKGLVACDHVGPALVGREPVILAGTIPKWLMYVPYNIIPT
jgi:hypothetical protein